MDVTRPNLNSAMMNGIQQGVEANPSADRERVEKNAMATMQARYGEKPKEARPVKKALDKDDFMRIMITEMKHQDPTKPMDADRMATQMAQITSVEQMKNVSNSLEKMADKNSVSDRLAMSMMIGKTVTVDKSRFGHQKSTISPINFELPEDADKIKMVIMDDRGEEIATRELEPMLAGLNVYNWDGLNSSNLQSPSGTYTIRIEAQNKQGGKIQVNPITRENIVGITFEGGDTNFLVGDAKSPQKVNLRNIIRLEGDAASRATSQPLKKNIESASLPENLKAHLGLNHEKVSDTEKELTEERPEGFPNGLQE